MERSLSHNEQSRHELGGVSAMSFREIISKIHGRARRSARLYPRPLYDYEFAKLDERPNIWDLVFSAAVTLYFLSLDAVTGSSTVNPFKRFAAERERMTNLYRAFRVVPRAAPSSSELTPRTPLRVLYAAHPKDFDVLRHSLESVIRHTQNPITEIVIISPDLSGANEAVRDSGAQHALRFMHEDEMVSFEARARLVDAFGPRYGWALQQFLKLQGVMSDNDVATLVVDSDTLFFRDKTWIEKSTQLLYFRGFNNPMYFDFLLKWNGFRADRSKSFVTHYQVMQSDLLRQALDFFFGTQEVDEIIGIVCDSSEALGSTDFSLDYETYGQFVHRKHPDRYLVDKYSNIGLDRSALELASPRKTDEVFPYYSASFHHYLDRN